MIRAQDRVRETFGTPGGPILIVDWCTRAFAAGCEMDDGLGRFPSYRSLFTTPEGLADMAEGETANVVLGLNSKNKIVGYCVFREPERGDFWGRLGPGTMYEIAGLEVSRRCRRSRLGQRLLHLGLTNEIIEDMIAYMVGYSWTWDLEGTGLTANEYRQMLMNMLRPYQFERYPTNEPNVCLRPENVFMARIGRRVPQETTKRFKNLLYGIV